MNFLDNKGVVSLEYVGIGGFLSVALIASLGLFSDDMQNGICLLSEGALAAGTDGSGSLNCNQENQSNTGNEETEGEAGGGVTGGNTEQEPPLDRTWFAGSGPDYRLAWSDPVRSETNDIYDGSPALNTTKWAQFYASDQVSLDACRVAGGGEVCNVGFTGLPANTSSFQSFNLDSNGSDMHWHGFPSGKWNFDVNGTDNRTVLSMTKTGGNVSQNAKFLVDGNGNRVHFYMGKAAAEMSFFNGFFVNTSIDIANADSPGGEYIMLPEDDDATQETTIRFFNTSSNHIRINNTHPKSDGMTFICRHNTENGFDEIEAVNPRGENTIYQFFTSDISLSKFVRQETDLGTGDITYIPLDEECAPGSNDYTFSEFFTG